VSAKVEALLAAASAQGQPPGLAQGVLNFETDPFLSQHVHSARPTVRGGAEPWNPTAAAAALKAARSSASRPASAAPAPRARVFVHSLYDDGPTEEFTEGMGGSEEENVAWTQTLLPALSLDGQWVRAVAAGSAACVAPPPVPPAVGHGAAGAVRTGAVLEGAVVVVGLWGDSH
jgi:hypothetical protein